jgi:hypothetical protein
MDQTIPLRLTLEIQRNGVTVRLYNPTDHEVRVWDLKNSRGGDSWSLQLIVNGASERRFVLRPTNQVYTRNLPTVIAVPAHGQKELRFTSSRREWTASKDLLPLRNAPIHVQAVLEVAPSPEATTHKVAVGRVESAEVSSQPPHPWLFGGALTTRP